MSPIMDWLNNLLTIDDGPEPNRQITAYTSAQDPPPEQEFATNAVHTAKYNLVTFLPRALFEQFRRLANVYFLVISILMIIGTYTDYFDSPVTPWSTIGPLVIMITIIMAKEGMEDLKRHQSDKFTNNQKALVLDPTAAAEKGWDSGALVETAWKDIRPGPIEPKAPSYDTFGIHMGWEKAFTPTAWKDIRPGDIVCVQDREPIPADLVLLASSEPSGQAYVETANIDGETNLKVKASAPTAADGSGPAWPQDRAGALAVLRSALELECDPPNADIYRFEGALRGGGGLLAGAGGGAGAGRVECPVSTAHLLLRGSTLRNTKWALGLAAYTGRESKLVMNSTQAPSKFSNLEQTVNKLIYVVFAAQFVLSTVSLIGYIIWKELYYEYSYYLCYDYADSSLALFRENCESSDEYSDAGYFFTFFILYCNFIPISIYVTIEVVNYCQAFFIDNDLKMYDEELDMPATARTSNMNSDLGQIKYIFSDKTGTLTRNVMDFKRCSVDGRIYGSAPSAEGEGERPAEEAKGGGAAAAAAAEEEETAGRPLEELAAAAARDPRSAAFHFCLVMAACHTVVLEKDEATGAVALQAESPDEEALAKAAAGLGLEFVERTPNMVTVAQRGGRRLTYEVCAVVPFDSTRKRMSVLLKAPGGGGHLLLAKGADNVMLARARAGAGAGLDARRLNDHLDLFAGDGLRTLVLARRELGGGWAKDWLRRWAAAQVDLGRREELLEGLAAELEQDLEIVGATAIEDKLQEEVPAVINEIGNAGIKLWVLTGDKMETAINIGYSCRLLHPDMVMIKLAGGEGGSGGDPEATARQVRLLYRHFARLTEDQASFGHWWQKVASRLPGAAARARGETEMDGEALPSLPAPLLSAPPQAPAFEDLTSDHLALVVEGSALLHIMGRAELERKFLRVARLCRSVIACRVSPEQKRLLVRLVKLGVEGAPITLAVGDGANDVGMIQEAQVGVGISGKEGRQAVNTADFAIAQFRFLRRLLFLHGRWDYRRTCKVVLYSFYKNMVLAFILFYFTCFCGWSGQSLYDSWVYAGYNFFLGMPILIVGLFDRDVSEKTALGYPSLYMSGRENMDMSLKIMGGWLFQGLVESICLFFIAYGCAHIPVMIWGSDGYDDGLWVFGTTVYSCLIFGMLMKCGFLTSSWTGWSAFFWFGSLALFYLFIVVYTAFSYLSYDFYYVAYVMMERTIYWLLMLLLPAITFLFDAFVYAVRSQFFHNPIDHAMEFDRGYSDDAEELERRRRLSTYKPRDRVATEDLLERQTPFPNFFDFIRVHVNLGALQQLNQTTSREEQKEMGITDTSRAAREASVSRGQSPLRRYDSSFAFDHPTAEYGPGGGRGRPGAVAPRPPPPPAVPEEEEGGGKGEV